MLTITQEQLNQILDAHATWVGDLNNGKRCVLNGYDLRNLDFSQRNLMLAHFWGSDCTRADFSDSDLRGAGLGDVNLTDALLINCDLSGANLGGANLSGANLTNAKLVDTQFVSVRVS